MNDAVWSRWACYGLAHVGHGPNVSPTHPLDKTKNNEKKSSRHIPAMSNFQSPLDLLCAVAFVIRVTFFIQGIESGTELF